MYREERITWDAEDSREDVHCSTRNDSQGRVGPGKSVRNLVDVAISTERDHQIDARPRSIRCQTYCLVTCGCRVNVQIEASVQSGNNFLVAPARLAGPH